MPSYGEVSVTNPWPKVFSLPSLNRGVGLEAVQVKSFVFAVEFGCAFFSSLSDGVDIIIDRHSDNHQIPELQAETYSSLELIIFSAS